MAGTETQRPTPPHLLVLTPTKDRPEALQLLSLWLENQTYQDFEWVVVTDGKVNSPNNHRDWFRRPYRILERTPGPEKQSLNLNLLHALKSPLLKDRPIAIMEDDDWYHPDYLKVMAAFHAGNPDKLVGVRPALYHNLKTRTWKNCGNNAHASLAQTLVPPTRHGALREAALDCSGPKHREQWSKDGGKPFLDIRLWKIVGGSLIDNFSIEGIQGRPLQVGIKAMPGTPGLGMGHRMAEGNDPELSTLKRWLGRDFRRYEPYL